MLDAAGQTVLECCTTLHAAIPGGDAQTARWWLERRVPEFSPKQLNGELSEEEVTEMISAATGALRDPDLGDDEYE